MWTRLTRTTPLLAAAGRRAATSAKRPLVHLVAGAPVSQTLPRAFMSSKAASHSFDEEEERPPSIWEAEEYSRALRNAAVWRTFSEVLSEEKEWESFLDSCIEAVKDIAEPESTPELSGGEEKVHYLVGKMADPLARAEVVKRLAKHGILSSRNVAELAYEAGEDRKKIVAAEIVSTGVQIPPDFRAWLSAQGMFINYHHFPKELIGDPHLLLFLMMFYDFESALEDLLAPEVKAPEQQHKDPPQPQDEMSTTSTWRDSYRDSFHTSSRSHRDDDDYGTGSTWRDSYRDSFHTPSRSHRDDDDYGGGGGGGGDGPGD